MDFLENALTLITLLSLFLFGPALGRALIACFGSWRNWSLPIQPWDFYVMTTKAVAIASSNIPTPTTIVISETLPNMDYNVRLATKLH
jgi:hypothetical protein